MGGGKCGTENSWLSNYDVSTKHNEMELVGEENKTKQKLSISISSFILYIR